MAERPPRPMGSSAPSPPVARRECLLRQKPRPSGRGSFALFRRALRRRAERHGQDHDVQGDHGPCPALFRIDPLHGRGTGRALAGRDRADGDRLCAAGAPPVAIADGGRASAPGVDGQRQLDAGTHLRGVPAPCRAKAQWRRPAFRRRAADAGDQPGAPDESAPAHHGRTDRRPCAGHRRACRGNAGARSPRRAMSRSS